MSTFVAAAQNTVASASSLTIGKPTGVAAGDIMLALVHHVATTTAFGAPTGWAVINTNTTVPVSSNASTLNATGTSPSGRWALFWKIAGASEPANYSWTGGSGAWVGAIVAYRGWRYPIERLSWVTAGNNSWPMFVWAPCRLLTKSGATVSAECTPADARHDGGRLLFVATSRHASNTPTVATPSGWTSRADGAVARAGFRFAEMEYAPRDDQRITVAATLSDENNAAGGWLILMNEPSVEEQADGVPDAPMFTAWSGVNHRGKVLVMEVNQGESAVVMVRMRSVSSGGLTGASGLTLGVEASKNGGAFSSISPSVVDRGSGWYSLSLTPSHTDTVGVLTLFVSAPGVFSEEILLKVVKPPVYI